jgi:hypothetical protein
MEKVFGIGSILCLVGRSQASPGKPSFEVIPGA